MCSECDQAAGDGGQQLSFGRKLGGGSIGDEGRDGDADKSMQRIPEEVEGGDFVGEKFDAKKRE